MIGIGFLLIGVVLMLVWRSGNPQFFKRKPETAARPVMAGPLVVGYDGTEGAQAALAEALRLAGALGVDIVVAFAYWAGALGGESADLLDTLRERGRAVTRGGAGDRPRRGRRRAAPSWSTTARPRRSRRWPRRSARR